MWTNLIDNAIYAVGGTGRIDARKRRDGEFFLVEIADNGSGIPPEARPHIFSVPFFTTKHGSGTGLGLVISHRIVVNGITEKSTSARVRMAHNLTCGCRLNRPRTLSPS